MAIDSIENNEMSALSSMHMGSKPFANDRGGYDTRNFSGKKRTDPGHGGKIDSLPTKNGYLNFLGIDLHGNAYHEQEAQVAAMERKYSPLALKTMFPLSQRDCDSLNGTLKAIVSQIDTINEQMVTMKGAFVPRMQTIVRNLAAHRDNILKVNAGKMCAPADVKEAEQEIEAALKATYSVKSTSDKIIIGVALTGVIVLAFFAVYKFRKSSAA